MPDTIGTHGEAIHTNDGERAHGHCTRGQSAVGS